MFQGSSLLTLDDKGRLSMPTRYRDEIVTACEGQLTITRNWDSCLLIYPRPTWEKKKIELAAMSMEAAPFARILFGGAQDIDLDTAGRMLVPATLRTLAGLERDVLLIGMGNRFELWNAQRY